MKNIDETKQKLISSAMRLYKRYGYANVTIEQICEAVGIAKNTYYYHFESKDALLLAYLLEQKDLTVQALGDVLFTEQNNFEKFWFIQKKRIAVLLDCGIDIICHLRDMKTVHSAFAAQHKEGALTLEAKIIKAAQADGTVRNQTDSLSLTAAGAMLFCGVLIIWIAMDGVFDLEQAVRSGFENLFDVRPDLRHGKDLYAYLLSTVQKQRKNNVKEKTNAR